jgi:hypothetical protein
LGFIASSLPRTLFVRIFDTPLTTRFTPLTLRGSASANELQVVASAKQAEVKARDEDIESEVKEGLEKATARASPR